MPKTAYAASMILRKIRADRVIGELDEQAWHRLSAGDGPHGERISDWTAANVPLSVTLPGETGC